VFSINESKLVKECKIKIQKLKRMEDSVVGLRSSNENIVVEEISDS